MLEMSNKERKNLIKKGIRIDKVERQVEEITKMIKNNGFTLDESTLIAMNLSHDIARARYHSGDTLLAETATGRRGKK